MEERGDELLAGAGLAADQHGDVAAGDARGGVEQAAHRPARADDPAAEGLLGGQPPVVDAQPARLERALDDQGDLVDVERLGEVVVGAGLHRRDRDALRAVRGEQDHRQRRIALDDAAQQLEAVHARASSRSVTTASTSSSLLSARRPIGRWITRCARARSSTSLQREEDGGLVVDEQDLHGHARLEHRGARGDRRRAPRSRRGSAA